LDLPLVLDDFKIIVGMVGGGDGVDGIVQIARRSDAFQWQYIFVGINRVHGNGLCVKAQITGQGVGPLEGGGVENGVAERRKIDFVTGFVEKLFEVHVDGGRGREWIVRNVGRSETNVGIE
jgi:hypothetical protein